MGIAFVRLDHVQVCIPPGCEEEARRFYSDILGLTEIEKPEALKPNGGLWYQLADIQLHIGCEDPAGKSKRHPAFEVEDLKAARAELEAHDVRIKKDTAIPGVERFSFFDPFDNRIELLQKL